MGRNYYRYRRRNSNDSFALVVIGMAALGSLVYGGFSSAQEMEEIMLFSLGFLLVITFIILGAIAFVVNRKNRRLARSNIDQVDRMGGEEFEHFVAQLCKKSGFIKVKVTSYEKDFGADVLGEKDGLKYAIQAKRYSNYVGIDGIYQILGGKEYYKADKAMLVTNAYTSRAAVELAGRSNVVIIDRPKLIDWILKVTA